LNRWVSLAACHRTRTDGLDSQATFHRRETLSQKSQSRTYRKVESTDVVECRAPDGDGRAAQGVALDHRRRQAARRQHAVGRPQAAARHDGIGDGFTPLVDDHGRARHQADGFVARECVLVRRQVTGLHDVILVEDGDDRRAAERDAAVPVSRQAQPLGVDLDAGPIAGRRANHVAGPVVRLVVRDDQLERDLSLS
jgi:hypothetical protein